jgi:hypothetical protein
MGLNNSIEDRSDEENDNIEYESSGSHEETDEYWYQDD